ncbi:hypothetical protein [Cellulosimicrobium sp. Marseille-Q4280]|uniref:hypothetical protein n=1 Tax=Cellulosimicrobium sp. Marseille-Q4280 TaxID=2937992 RepID=UPI0020421A74|nr:hypothetical protein [Cellulosimicrobium sp. Marseille-Q4280]
MSDPTPEQVASAQRLALLTSEDGDWLVDPESAQFHADIATLVRMAGVEPVAHSYGHEHELPDWAREQIRARYGDGDAAHR